MSTVLPRGPRRDSYRPGTAIHHWTPEEPEFWATTGARVAARNLRVSGPALLLACAVWQIWSVTVVQLDRIGFDYTASQKFWLTAVPGLTGATLQLGYTLLGPVIGGRRWTTFSTLLLTGPLLWLGLALRDTATPYPVMVVIAALCGIGGGNFAASMAGIAALYPSLPSFPGFPRAGRGAAYRRNAVLASLGVGAVQLLAPIANSAFLWIPPLLVTAGLAWSRMNELDGAARPFEQPSGILRRKHTWLLTLLQVGAFGSFIGFAAALPNLIDTSFTPLAPAWSATRYAWAGPFVGALAQWLGGRPGSRVTGARCTLVAFAGLALTVIVAVRALPAAGDGGNFRLCYAAFLAAFFFAGLGSGSIVRQLAAIFRDRDRTDRTASAVAGLSTAIASCGGFFLPAMLALFPVTDLLYVVVGYYALCLGVCWWYYAREGAEAPS
ncbi:nitrate/nitrite transporter [Kitasatospora sp. GAS1066B]|uniref:nitrate/nitrite transporter n=1 Tax=Kitasatospora sp. GAS1066B TaxID=3156271 RepID=UPI0035143017